MLLAVAGDDARLPFIVTSAAMLRYADATPATDDIR